MTRLLAALALAFTAQSAFPADWLIVSAAARADAGARFEITLLAPAGETLPDAIAVRIQADVAEIDLAMKAVGAAADGRRSYAATMPASASGPVTLRLADRPSNTLALLVSQRDAGQTTFAGLTTSDGTEPPLSENEPMYFILGTRDETTVRFQLSFKYRLFDATSGFGQGQPWLSGFYFGYTQNSLWDLSSESKAFRDTSYRPSFFWKWQRAPAAKAFFDGARLGFEHESNGEEGERSRSINIAFVRPEWRWQLRDGANFAFMPKLYTYLDKEENPDIDDYRGYADWRVRYDSGNLWIVSATVRYGSAGTESLLIDVSRRTRDLKFGPISGYIHIQYFGGYGEDIIDYNVKRKSQIRIGFAIVP